MPIFTGQPRRSPEGDRKALWCARRRIPSSTEFPDEMCRTFLSAEHLAQREVQQLHEHTADGGGAEHDRDVGHQTAGLHVHQDEQADHEAAAGDHRGDKGREHRVEVQLPEAEGHADHEAHGHRAEELRDQVEPGRAREELADRAGQQADDRAADHIRTDEEDGEAVGRDDEVGLHAEEVDDAADDHLEHGAGGQQNGHEDEVLDGEAFGFLSLDDSLFCHGDTFLSFLRNCCRWGNSCCWPPDADPAWGKRGRWADKQKSPSVKGRACDHKPMVPPSLSPRRGAPLLRECQHTLCP